MVAIRNEPQSTWLSARQRIRQAANAISRAASRGDDGQALSSFTLLTEFTDAARGADSFAEALRVALATLCNRLGAESAMLLESVSDREYRCSTAAGESGSPDCSLPARGFLFSRLESYPFPLALTESATSIRGRDGLQSTSPRVWLSIRMLSNAGALIPAVPLRTKSEMLGILLLGAPAGRDAYGPAE